MSIFSKNNKKKKLALTLACTSVLGGKTQAMNINKPQSRQAIAAVRGETVKNQPKKIDGNKIVKIGGFTVAGLAALETIHSLIGRFTDSKLGSYSIGRAIRNRGKKNNQYAPGGPKKVNSNDENDELKDDKMLNDNFKKSKNQLEHDAEANIKHIDENDELKDDKMLNDNFKKSKDQLEHDAEANIEHIKVKIATKARDQFEDVTNGLDSKKISQIIDRLKKQMLDYQNINIVGACNNEQKIVYGKVNGEIHDYSIQLLDNENKKEFVDIIKIFSGVFTGELSLEKEEFKFNNFYSPTIIIKKEGIHYNMSFNVEEYNVCFSEIVNNKVKRYIECKY